MRTIRVWMALACFLALGVGTASAQPNRKPGLWEITSTQTWQQSPIPPNLPPQAAAAMAAAFGGGPHTTQVCLTQAWIDKYGAPIPQSHGSCQATNVVLKPNGMTADWVCSGQMTGKGTMESSWDDSDHAKGKMHFAGTMQGGRSPNPIPVEFTVNSESVYKGPDCGSVQPPPMPKDH